jgi:hypothetical protein
VDDASPALRRIAPDVCARQVKMLPQKLDEECAPLGRAANRAAAQLCAQAASSSFACYLRSWSASRSITQGRKMSDWCAAFPARTPSATANAIAGIGVATSPQAKTPLTVVSFIASVL